MKRQALSDRVKQQVLSHLRESQPHVKAVEKVQLYDGVAFGVSFIGLNHVNQTNLIHHLQTQFPTHTITVSTYASDSSKSFELKVRVESRPWFGIGGKRLLLLLVCLCWTVMVPCGGAEFLRQRGWHSFDSKDPRFAMATLMFVSGYLLTTVAMRG